MAQIYRVHPKKRRFFFENFSLTGKIILINLIFYFASLLIIKFKGEIFFSNYLAITPSLILSGKSLWTFLTSIFVHVKFLHIFANMFTLFFIGSFLERIIGKKRFFWVYMLSGIVGGIFFIASGLIFNNLNTPAVGASGAIFGLLGVLAVLVPYSKIYLIMGPFILMIADVIIHIPLVSSILSILILLMIFSLFSFNPSIRKLAIPVELPMWVLPIVAIVPLSIISYFIPLPIGNSAHLGGLVVGLIYGFYLRKKFPKKTNYLSRVFR